MHSLAGDEDFETTDKKMAAFRKLSNDAGHMSGRGGYEKSKLLNKLATQKKIKGSIDQREYRLISGGDDGYVFFWNIPYEMVNEAKVAHQGPGEKKLPQINYAKLTEQKKNIIGGKLVESQVQIVKKIKEIKPNFELYLSGYAQIQTIWLCKEFLICMDNDNTVSLLKCSFSQPDRSEVLTHSIEQEELKEKINLPIVGRINQSPEAKSHRP